MDMQQLVAQALKIPRSFSSRRADLGTTWGFTPFSTYRDADCLTRANWEVITEDLQRRFPDSFEIMHSTCQLMGWVDNLLLNVTDERAAQAVLNWVHKLERYPVADDEKLAALEGEEIEETVDGWILDAVRKALSEDPELRTRYLDDGFWISDEAESTAWKAAVRHSEYSNGEVVPDLDAILEELRDAP